MSDFLDWSTLIYRAPALLIAMRFMNMPMRMYRTVWGIPRRPCRAAYGESSGSLGYGGAYASCGLRFRLGKTG